MSEFDARKYMELAIETMQKSLSEARKDKKVTPKVGAVLVEKEPDTSSVKQVTVAYRGELREGDHAEYTLLERKMRDQKLDNCVLFATLEPCAPNARKFPKLGCAERIVLARIKEVWVGIEDPDPTVDRKGIKYLQEHGVTVHMFDRDLQEIIHSENREFIEQALERVAAEENNAHEVILSTLETSSPGILIDKLSKEALQEYRSHAQIEEAIDSPAFEQKLARQNLLYLQGNQYIPNGFGTLLFGKEPRESMPQVGVLATINYPDGGEEIYDFDGPQVLVPRELLKWMKDKLPNLIDRSQAMRGHKNEEIFELVREGIVNALVHRDYDIKGAKIQLKVTPDKVEIISPGAPVPPVTIERLQRFDAPMLSRNPVLHYVFAKMEMAEERGLGLKSMKSKAEKAGLPLPKYTWDDPYLTLTIFLNIAAATDTLPKDILKSLNDSEQDGWRWMATKGKTTSSEYAVAMNMDIRTARRHLKHFVGLGLVRTSGSGPSIQYEVR